jgi:ABC-type uncharacterized transport system, permease component
MLTEVKNQIKVTLLAIKYALMKEMLNKATFISNVVFMILNNASMLIQWVVLYSLKDNIGGYAFKEVMLLWGLAAATYGVSRAFFSSAFKLSDTINQGKLDAFLVQPKNVLLNVTTTSAEASALGDILFGFIMIFVYGFSIEVLLLFLLFTITGGFIVTSFAVILGSLSFWLRSSDIISDSGNNLIVHFATYPDGIFKGAVKILLLTVIPVGIANYIPLRIIINFNLGLFCIVMCATIFIVSLAFLIFNRGLKRYSSSNLMSARI